MSEYTEPLEMAARKGPHERDRGMTLVELLVSMMVLGTIATVLAASLSVVWRQQPETQASADVARWEQALALWMPDDLSSASEVTAEPDDTCPSVDCSFGSNALWLSWNDGSGETIVSYRYGPSPDGETYLLKRVECVGGSCTSHTVLGDLAAPLDDDGNPILWNPGDPVPEDVISVTVPLQVGATSTDGDIDGSNLRAKRVIVSVNGAPGLGGVDRSSIVSFTAGGSGIGLLPTPSFSGPSFLEANSGCGGPVTLVVDKSGSIGGAIGSVRDGIRSFVNAFEGTPTKLQVVLFSSTASVLGNPSGWNKFYDLSDPADVSAILGEINSSNISAGGGTNWDDAMFRTFFAPNGDDYVTYADPNAPTPELVVFFTDGEPTFDRRSSYSGDDLYTGDSSAVAANPGSSSKWRYTDISPSSTRNGSEFSPRAWWRADKIVDQFRDVRLIGVGVGQAFRDTQYPYNDDRSYVPYSGWPNQSIPHEVFLGDLVTGGNPSQHPGGASGNYNVVEYNGGWGDVKEADLLVTSDFNQFGSALTQIALAECGGSLTVQTRTGSGATSDATVTYQIDDKTVTTNRIAKSGTFDIAIEGVASNTVDLVPQDLSGAGIGVTGWNCRAGGSDVPGAWSLIEAGNPAAGITVTVTASQAMSCTMEVTA